MCSIPKCKNLDLVCKLIVEFDHMAKKFFAGV